MCRRSLFAVRVFPQCAALFVLLLIPLAQIHAQTQAAMNAQARAEFVKVDAELNKTYEALLAKLPDAGILPSRWSADSSFLLWEVTGKWSPRALVLLKIEDGAKRDPRAHPQGISD
jgi:Lysozyme inhibitor LprI